jgi:prepilin-type N-terminal cleavage/methylation domain-containing protein
MDMKEANLSNLARLRMSLKLARGFTLIELLAVIAIIAIIAGMIAGLAPGVNQNKKKQRVEAEKHKLTALIDSYYGKFGHYPPDNPNLAGGGLLPEAYDAYTQINPLLYELTGGTNNATQAQANQPGTYYWTTFGGSFPQTEFGLGYGFKGILNADAEQQIVYKPLPASNTYQYYPGWTIKNPPPTPLTTGWPGANAASKLLQGLIVPVDMAQVDDPANKVAVSARTPLPVATTTNFWHYDASSPNRHNMSSYDLWAEFVVGKKNGDWLYVTNGNW